MCTPTAQTDMITFLIGQHREVDQIVHRLERLTGDSGEDADHLARKVVTALVQHTVAEELPLPHRPRAPRRR